MDQTVINPRLLQLVALRCNLGLHRVSEKTHRPGRNHQAPAGLLDTLWQTFT